MHWKIKGVIQKALSLAPGGQALHYQLQRRYGGLRNFDGELATKVDDWKIMVTHLKAAGNPIHQQHFFEIGSGWYPTFPFALYLSGARRITSYDLNRHMNPDLVRAAAIGLGSHLDEIAATSGADMADVHKRHQKLVAELCGGRDLEAASNGVVHYVAPGDATCTTLSDGEVDVVFSNSVLEHVQPATVTSMYREARRLLAPGGLMFHSVNCGDHYAYIDSNVNQLNYLRYSDRAWRFWNNSFLYQNRMRAHEFVDAAIALDYEILLDTSGARPERMRQLAETPIHAQFAHIPAEELCLTSVDFIARPCPRQ